MEQLEKIKIGIDLDDTVWVFHEKFFEFYNEKYNENLDINNLTEYNLRKFLGVDDSEMEKLFYEFEKTYEFLPEIDNARESIFLLEENHEIYFVTARPSFYRELVNKRLMNLFGKTYPVIFQYDENIQKIKEKYDFCKEIGITVMIDDGFHNLKDCADNGMKCFLIDNPWNKNEELNENIIRVDNWNEIIEELKK